MTMVRTLSLATFTHGDARARAAFSDALFEALADTGFAIVEDHGVGEALLERAYALAEAVFALPDADKRACAGLLRGWTPMGVEHAKGASLADLKEFWQVGRDRPPGAAPDPLFPPNVWPAALPDFEPTFRALFQGLEGVGRVLLSALAPRCGVAADHFDALIDGAPSLLRVLHYPPVPDDAPPGAVRAAAHEDIDLITLLVAARGAGLELLDRTGAWVAVEGRPGALIVDTGDMMMRLTNGRLPSTTHRVVNPVGPNVSRHSMPFFVHPKNETVLAPLPAFAHEPARFPIVTAGAYLAERLGEIGLAG